MDQQKPMFWKGFEVGRFLKQNCDSTKWINELQNTRSSLNPFWLDLLLNSRTSKMLWTKTSIETGGVLLDLGKSSAVRIESSHFAVWSYFLGNLQNRWRVVYNMKSENAIPKPKSKRRMKVFFFLGGNMQSWILCKTWMCLYHLEGIDG